MTDGQLVECFVSRHDEVAFEALVRRHGPMVLGVCRRLLSNPQDAEDAFQATFLVLVRKAASLRQPELLGNWLYGVAYRTALATRAAVRRRRAREKQVSRMPEPEAGDRGDVGRDLGPLLDRELNRLPAQYRVAVVLCDLQGRTRREVAQQLGIPVGTLSGRLTTARRLLAKRLGRHGLVLAGGALTAALAPGSASAHVPSALVARAVAAATAVAAGQGVAGVVSVPVASLAEGVLKAMAVQKLKIATAILLAAGILAGAAVLTHDRMAAEAVRMSTEPPYANWSVGMPRTLNLGTGHRGRYVAWSPDGKTLAVRTFVEKTILGFQYERGGGAIKLWDVATGQARQTLAEGTVKKGVGFGDVVFSPDGKTIATTVSDLVRPNATTLAVRYVVKVWDAKTLALKQTLGGIDSLLLCLAFSPDGKLLAAGDSSKREVQLWHAETGELEATLKTGGAQPLSLAFSPDSKTLAVGRQDADRSGEVTLWDVKTRKVKHALKPAFFVGAVLFAPDGKMIAASDGGELVQLWDVEKGQVILSLKGNGRFPRTLAFWPNGKILAVGG